ncbi:hypothetical protein E4U41_004486 [Claviceps citrina]|nr:hypothetical protein E4U41_004486 [Claviceps citrina]
MKASFAVTGFAAAASTFVAASPLLAERNDGPPPRSLDVAGYESAYQDNDYACRSSQHRNPVVMLHALGANKDFDLNFLAAWLRPQGFCTFSLTYGNAPGSRIGGLDYINKSAPAIAAFVKQVAQRTGSARVDLVGHSEGGLQALYVAKFEGVAPLVDKIVALAPPTHGTSLSGLWTLVRMLGRRISDRFEDVLRSFGCRSCTDMVTGSALLTRLAEGPIVQRNNTVTVIASEKDVVVTPPETAFVRERGVHNLLVQKDCPGDRVGHYGLAVSPNVWHLVLNALEGKVGRKYRCISGIPLLRGEAGVAAAEVVALED